MSYQVLARKYRPKGFDTLVGQEHVVRALSHALDSGRLHHAYLFTGTRGVGKTTLSRILAKAFNCLGADGNGSVTSTPCGVCDACVAIDGGRFVDYIEIDAASNRGVDEMAQLLEQAVYAPSNARFKVYMIDEVHMLTNHAFNAMLKTLEEPPAHVKFILATTDPQKIPVTVLSRCLQFNLKQMPPAQIIAHLTDILGQEAIPFETPALRLLAQGAHGSMRDALSLTDQAIAYAAGNITLEAVQGMLGALDQSFLVRILEALAQKDGVALIAIAEDMASRSLSYNAALQDIGSLLHRIALAQMVPAAIADDLPERADILRLAALFEPEEIQLFYQIAVHGRNELGLAPDDFAGFSMTLLRMLAFRPALSGADDGPLTAPVAPAPHRATTSIAPPALLPVSSAIAGHALPAVGTPAVAPGRASAALAAAEPFARASASLPPADTQVRASGAISPARAALNAARAGIRVPGTSMRAPVSALASAPALAPAPVSTPALPSAPAAATAVALPATTKPRPVVSTRPTEAETPMELAPAPPWDDELIPASAADTGRAYADEHEDEFDNLRTPGSAAALVRPSMPVAQPAVSRTPPIAPALAKIPPATVPAPAAHVRITALGWDGDWPTLAAALPLRGVVLQLAQQSELLGSEQQGDATCLQLQVAIETLRASATVEKLALALSEHFSCTVRVETRLGPVHHSANLVLLAARAQRQRQAEQTMQADPFIQSLQREFGATIVPGSIKPISIN